MDFSFVKCFLPFSYFFLHEYFYNLKIKGLVGCHLPSLSGSVPLFPLLVGDHSNPACCGKQFSPEWHLALWWAPRAVFLAALEMPLKDLAHFYLDGNKKIPCKHCTHLVMTPNCFGPIHILLKTVNASVKIFLSDTEASKKVWKSTIGKGWERKEKKAKLVAKSIKRHDEKLNGDCEWKFNSYPSSKTKGRDVMRNC